MKLFRGMSQIVCAVLFLCVPAFAQNRTTIRWAGGVIGNNADAAVNAPDGKVTTISASGYLYLVSFNDHGAEVTYPLSRPDPKWKSLEALLRLPAGEIKNWDLIAFEGNGNESKGWESSVWFVSDFKGAAAGVFNADTRSKTPVTNPPTRSPLRFMSGTISRADYFDFFGIDASKTAWNDTVAPYASWILVDVPTDPRGGIDVKAPGFKLFVTGGQLTTNAGLTNPDPDAFGVIVH